MRYKRKLILVVILVVVLTIIQFILPAHSKVVGIYDAYIFRPFQSVRNSFFSMIPFIIVSFKWVYYLSRFRTHKHELGISLIHSFIIGCSVYIVFILGWGGNYYKPSLTTYWGLNKSGWSADSSLRQYDAFLIGKLNDYSPGYRSESFRILNRKAKKYFKKHTDSKTKLYGVKVKASLFGFLMQHLGIQGYYNPWTGEAQVNSFLPSYMLPYIICHEMAHQAGVAAEDDANLFSYALATREEDSVFKYSAYFNLWLYTHSRLKSVDSTAAGILKQSLNPLTLAHLDTLRQIRQKYAGDLNEYSGILYDGYLKLHHQKDGINSYNRVCSSAWAYEIKQTDQKEEYLEIP
jgi:hypothetical protein